MSGGRAVLGMALVVLLLTLRCDKTFVGPDYKNPRDYTWTVDTISAGFQTLMYDIYATSPSNVYLAGHSSENGRYVLWHFDGVRWSPVQWWQSQPYGISLEAITGFGPSDIYAVGRDWDKSQALALHFDGVRWTDQSLPGNQLLCVSGNSPTDVWAAGLGGTAFHFDGQQWDRLPADSSLRFQSIRTLNSVTYGLAYSIDEQPQDTIWDYFLRWNNRGWDTLTSRLEVNVLELSRTFGSNTLVLIDNALYSAGGGIFKWDGAQWDILLSRAADVFGTTSTNIFAVGTYGQVEYYDGSTWYEFDQFKSNEFHYFAGWTNGREVFIAGENGEKSIVWHGK